MSLTQIPMLLPLATDFRLRSKNASGVPFAGCATAVGHPVQPLSDVWCARAVCAQYSRPAGVAFSFQVAKYSIEPPVPNRSFNLLANDCVRAALSNEPKEFRPDVPIVGPAFLLARCAERLAGARACPNRSISGPSGKVKGEGPAADTGEEVALDVSGKVRGLDIGYAPCVDVAFRNQAAFHEFLQPRRRGLVPLVVVVQNALSS